MFKPNDIVTTKTQKLIILAEVGLFLAVWMLSPSGLLPKPGEIWVSAGQLWRDGLAGELWTSLLLNIQAILWSTAISLALAYSTVIPVFRPMVHAIGKLRFLSLVGLSFIFTILATSGHELKLSLLVFSVSVFFVTSMADVIDQIPKEQYDLARTLRMNEWQTVWEVVILGQADKVFDVLRQNAAIGWMMLSMVESTVRSEGGIGTMLMDQNHHFHLAAVFAIQITILLLGLGQDYSIGFLKSVVCPYSGLGLERK